MGQKLVDDLVAGVRVESLRLEVGSYVSDESAVWEGIRAAFAEGRLVFLYKGGKCSQIDPWGIRNSVMKELKDANQS